MIVLLIKSYKVESGTVSLLRGGIVIINLMDEVYLFSGKYLIDFCQFNSIILAR